MTAWIVRSGLNGERDSWCIENGVAGGGWHEVPSLAERSTREAIGESVAASFPPDTHPGKLANYTGQLLAIRSLIKPGDLVVLPMKTTKQIAIGVCTAGYDFRTQESDSTRRHSVRVDWKNTEVSRGAIKDDLLNTVNGAMTIFRATKNNAESRLTALMNDGVDPGSSGATSQTRPSPSVVDDAQAPDVTDPTAAPSLQSIRDRVRTHLVENFGGHKLTHLVADILRAEGFVCDVSPEGPDHGVDIIGGSGSLGMDSPTLIVEVKSEAGQIGSTVVRGLQGAMTSHRADQGLLVAWGGLNKQAKAEIRTDRLSIRVWDSDDVLDRLFSTYERLPSETQRQIPLKLAWVLDEEYDV